MEYSNYSSGGYSPEPERKPNAGFFKKLLWIVPVVILLAGLVFDSFYTLKEDQYAVITTFGKPATVSASGLQFKLPFVQKCIKVSKSVQPVRMNSIPGLSA